MLQQKMSTTASSAHLPPHPYPQKYSCFSGEFQTLGVSNTSFSWCQCCFSVGQCCFSAAQCWNRNCPKTHHMSFSTKPNK